METVMLSLVGHGTATEVVPTVLSTRCTATVGALVGRLPGLDPHETPSSDAVLESRIDLRADGSIDQIGTLSLHRGDVVRFRGRTAPSLTSVPAAAVRHGAAILDVDGGSGRFRGATGRIASNFLLSETGELTTYLAAVVFLPDPG